MTPKNIPQMKFDSRVFSFTPKLELPSKRGRMGVFKNLSFYSEIVRAFAEIKKEGVAPFEDAVTIDLNKVSAQDKPLLKQKNPSLSFYIHLRALAKQFEIQKYVEIRRIGNQIHIVGT